MKLTLGFVLLVVSAAAQEPRFEAGAQFGVLDQREVFDEKPAIAGGRATVRLVRYLAAEAEVNRYPIGGGYPSYPATQVLLGARVGGRVGPFGLFATVRPGWMLFENNSVKYQDIGTRPAVNLGLAVAAYGHRHLFARIDFGDLIVSYGDSGYGTRHHFQGTAGFGVWF
jgi:hypothetical protein